MLLQHPELSVAVYFGNTEMEVLPQEVGATTVLKDMVAVSVVNVAAEGLKGCLKMDTNQFQQAGNRLGCGLML